MTIAKGVFKEVRYKKETSFGVAAGTSGGQIVRRLSSDIDISKATFASQELRSDQQIADFRHGMKSVGGGLQGELSPKTYFDFLASLLRCNPAAGVTSGAQADISVTSGVINRATGSWLTNGFKIGDVVRATGFVAADNNGKNLRITALTASNMTVNALDGSSLADEVAGASVTIAVVGKKLVTPTSNLLDESYTIENWFSDTGISELFVGCKPSQVQLQLPATGIATISIAFTGKDSPADGAVAYFTAPAAATTTGTLAAPNGMLRVGNTDFVTVTGMNITINADMSTEACVGTTVTPEVFPGIINVQGQFTAFYQNGDLRAAFLNEEELGLYMHLLTGSAPDADFLGISIARIKLGGASKNDVAKGIIQSVPFQALQVLGGGTGTAYDTSTMVIQDSAA